MCVPSGNVLPAMRAGSAGQEEAPGGRLGCRARGRRPGSLSGEGALCPHELWLGLDASPGVLRSPGVPGLAHAPSLVASGPLGMMA